jgi:hypothetical protein
VICALSDLSSCAANCSTTRNRFGCFGIGEGINGMIRETLERSIQQYLADTAEVSTFFSSLLFFAGKGEDPFTAK